jgi:hypothetical protein
VVDVAVALVKHRQAALVVQRGWVGGWVGVTTSRHDTHPQGMLKHAHE